MNKKLSITHSGPVSINKNLSITHPEPVSINKNLSRTPPGPVSIKENLIRIHPGPVRRVPMWQQSGTLLFGSCHGIARFLVDESQI